MPDAVFAVPSFHGGEISKFAQGRFDRPDYRISLNVCLNGFPTEAGAWTRRPGTRYAGHTRRGAAAKVAKFDFQQANPYTLEFTDGWLRFRTGTTLVPTNDTVEVTAVSAATPAVLQTAAAVTWATNDTLIFLGQATALLENRQFTATKIDTTHFSLADALTGAAVDGSTLGTIVAGALVRRVQELATSYTGGAWGRVRSVQAEDTSILLEGAVAPQALTVTIPDPLVGNNAVFSIADAVFNDGPYLDPFTNGVQATPSAVSGIITLQLSFPAWSATKAYRAGDFVSTGGVNYRSLLDQNVNHAPGGGAPWWITASAAEAINDGRGFLGTDIGRLVRMFSEPAAWAVGSAYVAGNIVSYNPSGLAGDATYWQALAGSTGKAPGSDLTNWQLIPQGAAIWTWGRITGLSNVIDRALAGSASLGNMTSGGGLAAAFDGVFSQAASASAERTTSGASVTAGTPVTFSSYVGKNYSGATDQAIQQATIYPSSDSGFVAASGTTDAGTVVWTISIVFNLRGKATLPVSAADGTLLGTSGSLSNGFSAITVVSGDQATAWKYVWVEQVTTLTPSRDCSNASYTNAIAELSLFNPPGTGTGTGATVEILGPALLYTTTILTWRLGVYSDTTGYPTCGTYHEGRLWLAGAVDNRFDACVSNGIDGGTVNFAPTNQYGTVAASSAISYVLNSDGANPIFWMTPDLQGIIIGTQAGEWLVQAPTTGPIAPTNIAARRTTRIGSANVEPRRTEHTNVFAQRHQHKLLEHFADAYSGKFTAPNLAERAEHITNAMVAEIAYTNAVTPILWGRCDDNSLFGVTYKRDTLTTSQGPTFAGFHRHTLGTAREVESICSGPSPGGELDALTMVTNETATGIRHVEVLTDMFDEEAALADAWFLDDAVNPSSVSSTLATGATTPYGSMTINGLWHLNGKTVQVFAGGLDCGDPGEGGAYSDFVVANGSVTVPYGDGISSGPGRGKFTADFANALPLTQIVVGMTYNSDGQLVRPVLPQDAGTRTGPALGATRRLHQYSMLLSNSRGISIGTTFTAMYPVKMRKANGNEIDDLTTYSGVSHDTIKADNNYDNMICWRISRPWPASVIAISGNIQAQDR